jgi:hypothetical protein
MCGRLKPRSAELFCESAEVAELFEKKMKNKHHPSFSAMYKIADRRALGI